MAAPVITGLGIVAAPGRGIDEIWSAVSSGASGLKPLSLFPSPRYGQVPVGEIDNQVLQMASHVRGSRTDRLGWLAARDAITSAKLDTSDRRERIGAVLGSSVGGSFGSEIFLEALIKRKRFRPNQTRYHECSSVVDCVANSFGLLGPGMAISTACSSGALAIATAAELIQSGEADVMLAGGADSLARMTWAGFHSLLLVDPKGCRPFDAERAGMSLGEGAAVIVLESEVNALRRGAQILARLTGWGASCDAYHATAPDPQGAGAAAAMCAALRCAGLDTAEINYINAHGTGTRDNDLAEAKAIRSVFGSQSPPVSSTKRAFGHALAASGAIEAVVCIEALQRQQLPSNAGFKNPDASIDLIPVTSSIAASLRHVMSNSFGFGGNNCALIFSAPQSRANTRSIPKIKVAITGLGIVGPGSRTEREVEPPLPTGKVEAYSCGPLADAATLTPNQRRRLNRISQMALLAARRCHKANSDNRVSILIGTGLGCLEDGGIFLENMIAKDEQEPMPARFPGSVHNAPAAQIAIDLGAKGLNSAPTSGEISFECALWQGILQLATKEADCALVGAVDELNKYPLGIGKRWGIWTSEICPGEGAMVSKIVQANGIDDTTPVLAHITAVRLGRYRSPFSAEQEVDWVTSSIDVSKLDVVITGAKGWAELDPAYNAFVSELSSRVGRTLDHRIYKNLCGEFNSASAFGFAQAVQTVQRDKKPVLLYTLALRGAKALCFLEP